MDSMEQDAAKQADTVKSVMAKSKIWLIFLQRKKWFMDHNFEWEQDDGECNRTERNVFVPCGSTQTQISPLLFFFNPL